MKKKLLLGLALLLSATQMKAQNEYVEALQSLQRTFLELGNEVKERSKDLSDAEKQQGANFLTSVYDLMMESYVYKGDPANPAITSWMSDYRKFGGDSPHTIYLQIPVNSHYTYLLKGKLGSGIYMGFQAYGEQSGFNLPTENLSLKDLVVDNDGNFEIVLSEHKPKDAENWLKLTPGDHAIIIRQYFDRRKGNIPAEVSVKRTDNSTFQSPTYTQRIKNAERMLVEGVKGTFNIIDLQKVSSVNRYAPATAEIRAPKYAGALYPTKDNKYEGFWVSLKKGEAIHLHGRLPKALYASYLFYNRWNVSPDYKKIRSFLTDKEIELNPDGTFDLYISPEKIDHPNWIDTGGLYEGCYASRYLQSESDHYPTAKVVKISTIPVFKKKK